MNMQCIYNRCANVKTFLGATSGVNKKSDKGSGKKNSQLVLRLDKDERDAFVELCKEMDTSAAREIRAFIRSFMKEHSD